MGGDRPNILHIYLQFPWNISTIGFHSIPWCGIVVPSVVSHCWLAIWDLVVFNFGSLSSFEDSFVVIPSGHVSVLVVLSLLWIREPGWPRHVGMVLPIGS